MAITTHHAPQLSLVSLALGLWLFVSAFLWPHTESQYHSAWIVGALATVVAAAATQIPAARWGNTGLGLWTLMSVFILPTLHEATFWNHLLVGLALFAVSLVPGYVERRVPQGRL